MNFNYQIFIFLVAACAVFTSTACYSMSKLSRNKGGIIASPVPIFLAYYFLIFFYRPIAILIYNAPTLADENIDYSVAIETINVGLLSLLFFLTPFVFYQLLDKKKYKRIYPDSAYTWSVKITKLYVVLNLILCFGLWAYGSALNIGYDRLNNPGNYSYYFIYLLAQRLHGLTSVIVFYIYLKKEFKISLLVKALILLAPFWQLISAGRGPFINAVISYGVVYIISRGISLNFNKILKIILWGSILFVFNYFIAGVRVIINSNAWDIQDLLNYAFQMDFLSGIESALILGSWDYCVFDTLARILKSKDELLFGVTSLNYFAALIPRGIWEDKPYDLGYMPYITLRHYAEEFYQTGSTFVGTLAGEGYINYGYIGVAFYSMIYGTLMLHIFRKTIKNNKSTILIVYALILPLTQNVARGGLDVLLNFLIMVIIPFEFLKLVYFNKVEKTEMNSFGKISAT